MKKITISKSNISNEGVIIDMEAKLTELANTMDIKQKRLEFLNETVAYYSEDVTRRSKSMTYCYYDGKNAGGCTGEGCAIGRKLTPEKRAYLDKEYPNQSVSSVIDELPEYMQDMGVSFLRDIQGLHDNDSFWSEKGLTEGGKLLVESIKKKYC